jgi:hypothetical protein
VKKFLFGIAFVLALAFAPKAHAYPYPCSGQLIGDVVIQGTTATYWEACNYGSDEEIVWIRVSWWVYEWDIKGDDPA